MKDYKVYWTKSAKQDLREIIDYISINSKENALNILNLIAEKTSELKKMPFRCRILPELKELNIETYRELIVNPWRLIFKVINDEVFVIAVLDGLGILKTFCGKKFSKSKKYLHITKCKHQNLFKSWMVYFWFGLHSKVW